MKKGETGTGVIGMTAFPDRGYIEREDGKILFKHAIPGREVEYRITKRRGDRGEGMVLSVLKPSPLETEKDPCPHAGDCGGCLYQTLPYREEAALKERQMKELLDEIAGGPFAWEGVTESPASGGYRAKMEFSFGDTVKDGPLALGMHRRGSHYDIVTADRCRLVHPDFNLILRATLDYFTEQGVPYFHKLSHEGQLRHLLVRRGAHSGEILTDLVHASGLGRELLEGWRDRIAALPLEGTLAGILHTVNDSPADAVIDQGTEVLYGKDWFTETLSGLSFKITPFSFFQNNSGGAELLYGKVAEYAGDTAGKTVFDLYSGTGTIAQIVAKTADRTVGVEIVPEAVRAAEENAARNGITNCSFIAGDVLKVLDSLEAVPDVIILDPPREGVHPKALPKLLKYGVPRIIYVSCKPTSLRTDIAVLREGGYSLTRAAGVDMFPRTAGCELVCLFERERNENDGIQAGR